MTAINSLYELFDLAPNCTNDELRRAYHRLIRNHHPDLNPGQVETATARTQQLTAAYAELKEHRKYLLDDQVTEITSENHEGVWEDAGEITISVTITFSFGSESSVDLEDIAKRKSSFRLAWNAFRQNPTDVIRALQLIHAAFEAERQDAINDLLINSILIDAASLLVSYVEVEAACETLIRWADILYHDQLAMEGIQILEDTLALVQSNIRLVERIGNELRSMHYGFAQGYAKKTNGKPPPEVRIKHLNRILELGFEFDYIYKLLAEAFYEAGDNEQARIYLEQAYKINPELSGAVRISRTLGFLPEKQKPESAKQKKRAKYKYTRPEHIPSPNQIRQWESAKEWDEILAFADLSLYSPRIIPKSRNTIRQIASSFGGHSDGRAIVALTELLKSVYWDVRMASMSSLAKIGDHDTLKLLQTVMPSDGREVSYLQSAISYLQSRLENQLPTTSNIPTAEIMEQAKQAIARQDFGQARFLLENIAINIDKSHELDFEIVRLMAQVYAKIDEQAKALDLVKPRLTDLPINSNREFYEELTSWLWSYLVFEEYDVANDEEYLLALNTHLDLALTAKIPDEVLGNLRRLTRWMELLGDDIMTQWIRSLIRTEAPGTWYVDSHNRDQYIRKVELSSALKERLHSFNERIKTNIPKKLSEVMKSADVLSGPDYLLND